MVKAGDELFRLADLSSIWVIADVAEQDIGRSRSGASQGHLPRLPDEVFEGHVTLHPA